MRDADFVPLVLARALCRCACNLLYAFWTVDGTMPCTTYGTASARSGGNGRPVSVLRVHLDDGREIDASAAFRILPHNGAQIVVAEAHHASGLLTYRVQRVADP